MRLEATSTDGARHLASRKARLTPAIYPSPASGKGLVRSRQRPGWRTRAGHHPWRRQSATRQVNGSVNVPLPLPDGTAHPRRHPCYSKPQAAQPRSIAPERDQASQHQDYQCNPKQDHAQPGVRSVWCSVPMFGFGYRGASGQSADDFTREAADLARTEYSVSSPSARRPPHPTLSSRGRRG